MNEGILDTVKKLLKRVGDFFRGIGSSFLNGLIRQSKGDLPKGVTLYPSKTDMEILKAEGVKVKLPSVRESFEYVDIDEAKVELDHPNANVPNVGVNALKEALRDVVEAGDEGIPLLIWGAPGIGKTSIIEEIAKEFFGPNAKQDRRIIDYDLMSMSPEDFFLPAISGKDKSGNITDDSKLTRLPDEYLPLYRIGDPKGNEKVNGPDGQGGVLFFDELARANKRVQNVCLKLINERRLGSYVLGDKWVIVAAANREGDDDTGTYDFSSTLGNRFKQVNYSPKFEDWAQWAEKATDKRGDLIVAPEILAFIRFNHEKYFHDLDPQSIDRTGGKITIYPSPRQWTNASKALKERERRLARAGKREMTNDERETIVSELVGRDAASAYMGFLKLLQKINPRDIENVWKESSKAPDFKNLSIDEKNAFIASIIFSRNKKALTDKELENFTDWLISIKDAPFAIKSVAMLQATHPELLGKEDEDGGRTGGNDFWNEDCKNKLFDSYPKLKAGR
jgi:MoxR-like ATPase